MNDLEINEFVFVYGTLKKGYGNSRIFLRHGAEYMGQWVTKHSYILGDIGFPYMFDREATSGYSEDLFKQVVGDLWHIPNEACLAALDGLEGVPHHYQRNIITLEDGTEAWSYLQHDDTNLRFCSYCDITEDNQWIWR